MKYDQIIKLSPVRSQEDCTSDQVLVAGNELVKEAENSYLEFFNALLDRHLFDAHIGIYNVDSFCSDIEADYMCENPPIISDCHSIRDDTQKCQKAFNGVNLNYIISHVITRVLNSAENQIDTITQFRDNYDIISDDGINKKFAGQFSDLYDAIDFTINSLSVIQTHLKNLNVDKAEKILKLGRFCMGEQGGVMSEMDRSINCAYLAELVAKEISELIGYSAKQYLEIKNRSKQ
ncbi:hypothetical protein AYI69_g10885 [Smittium culicis]|uniref:Uncharacterized protein n=1 Tax=Smittium culicis TaxID=133412 RepID=A0A1R1X2R5_9FUNG|nr:hypothetical protein AYI69_g10885 [Smittium culicis]